MTDKKEKPVIFSDNRTDAEKFDPRLHRGSLDPSRIPGYSEIVQANDIAKADDLWFREANQGLTKEDLYRQIGAKPAKLPVELQWLPVSGAAGGLSRHQDRVLDGYVNQQGFRLATTDDLDRYGYGFPPNGRLAEDGSIRRGSDVALFIRDGEVAKMWEDFKFQEQKELENATASQTVTAGAYETEVTFEEEDRETVTVKH